MPAPPNSGGVLAAVRRLQPHMSPTPLYRSDSLSRGFDADVWLKVETATPIASFKLRGALNTLLINREFGEIRTAVTSSTGNHGQGVAYAARLLNSPADIFLPDGANPVKQAMIRLFGGRLHLGGRDIDEAKDRARVFCEQNGGTFVDDGESGTLIEGAGTIGDEIARSLEGVDYAFLPMGSGSLASGVAIGLKAKQAARAGDRRAIRGSAGDGGELPRPQAGGAALQHHRRRHRLPRAGRDRAECPAAISR